MRAFSAVLLLLFLTHPAPAQHTTYVVTGIVSDSATGRPFAGATVVGPGSAAVATGADGKYSLGVPAGHNELSVSFVGYDTYSLFLDVRCDTMVEVRLSPSDNRMERVVVVANHYENRVFRTETGVEHLSAATIGRIPALMGEVDILKAAQLLPGVLQTSEGAAGFSVRGGSHDQNLILLDDATIYGASHLMGFFSVFNNDAVRDVALYKGDIPASFGGRLSSLLDVRTRTGEQDRVGGTGGIGLISSRLTVDGPIADGKVRFLVSARRTYADMFLFIFSDPDVRSATLYFYDMNAGLDVSLGSKDRLHVSGYLGRDKFGMKFAGMDFGNKTLSVKWNHNYGSGNFSNVSFVVGSYDYHIDTDFGEKMKQFWKSGLTDLGLRADWSWTQNDRHSLRWGASSTLHMLQPGEGGGKGDDPLLDKIDYHRQFGLESGLYLTAESVFGRVRMRYGVRASMFNNISNGHNVDVLAGDFTVDQTRRYRRGNIYNSYGNVEPRVGVVYELSPVSSLKASYTRSSQYIQVASNSASGSPLDVWFLSSLNIRPQVSDQYATGYFRTVAGGTFDLSAELYYRNMRNVIDFKDHVELIGNEELEREVRSGRGYAYGLELMLRKDKGDLTGWVSYTWSRSKRKVEQIYGDRWYRSPYDKPHSLSLVVNYKLNPKWSLSANWIYSTGNPVTYPTGKYMIEGEYVPIYSGRNQNRYPAYHRLDVGATVDLTKPGRRFRSELNMSLYNAYGRKNPWTIRFVHETSYPFRSYAEMVYLFSFVPSLTWNFTF